MNRSSTPSRLPGLDIARGIAVLGMLGAHTVGGSSTAVDAVVHGRPSVLFFLLAGVTIGLTASPRPEDDALAAVRRRTRVFIRAGVVLALGTGMLLVGLQSVLPVHAVLIALLGTLLAVRSRVLVVTAVGMLVVLPQATVASGSSFDFDGALDGAPAQLRGALTVLLPAAAYAACSVTGLLLGRTLRGGRFRPGAVALGGAGLTILAFGGSGVVAALGVTSPFLSGAGHSGSSVEIAGSIGAAVVVLAGAVALPDAVARVLAPVGAVGTLALTMYVLHFPLAVVLLAVLGQEPPGQWAAFGIAAVVLCGTAVLVLRRFRRGPLEHLVATTADRLTRPVRTTA